MGRTPCCEKNWLKKGPWTPEEDQKLIGYIQKHGYGSWRTLPKNAGLARCGKSCRLRWTNYLRPDIKRGRFSFEEEETIIQLHSILGNKWSAIAARLPGRTDNEIKNYWNTHIRKRLLRMGIDPVTHIRRLDLLDLSTLLTNPLTMYNNPAQFDVSQLLNNFEPIFNNSEFLRVASNLLSPQCHQDSSNQVPLNSFPICTTSNNDADQLLSESQVMMQPNNIVGQFHHDDQPNLWHADGIKCNFSENFGTSGWSTSMDDSSNFYWADNQVQNYGLVTSAGCNSGSGLTTTPVSSPTQLNSGNSTYITSSVENERDSNCSEILKFGLIPDLLDVGDFL